MYYYTQYSKHMHRKTQEKAVKQACTYVCYITLDQLLNDRPIMYDLLALWLQNNKEWQLDSQPTTVPQTQTGVAMAAMIMNWSFCLHLRFGGKEGVMPLLHADANQKLPRFG